MESAIISIATSIVAKIAEYTVAPVGRQFGYLFYYARNVDDLKSQMQKLKEARVGLQHRVEEEKNKFQEIEDEVLRWMSDTDQISQKAETFLNHEGHKAVCSCVSLPHLVTRYQLSREAKKMSLDVASKNSKLFDKISYRPPLESSFAYSRGYDTFDSRRKIMEGIMAVVRDDNMRRIGFYGMGGIGKTMLAKEIAKQAEKEELFSKVVMTVISQKPNMEKIQQDIAAKLKLEFKQTDTMDVRAGLLRTRLKRENRILLILDDIWEELNLEVIGIHDECKMLLTSRYRDVLHNFMGIDESNIFFVEPINRKESISLFKKIVGDIVETVDFDSLADKIVDECAGLPVAIVAVASALKGKSLSIWEHALERLRSSKIRAIQGMDKKVYSCIKMSYDFLESDDGAKSLLLLCALHKEDQEIEIEDLMRYSVGWGLHQGINTMKEVRNWVDGLVDKLKSLCLLLDGENKNCVKMHDVVRDVCIIIASEEDKHKMSIIKNVKDFVTHETHKAFEAISLLDYDNFSKLPEKLECPKAKLLLLSSTSLESIPNYFFEQTTELEALAMNKITPSSSSFCSLKNLQTLCLHRSKIEDIALIGHLKNLKVLDLSHSFIERLPKEIGELCHLQLLDLRKCLHLKIIEPNVISNLIRMEELYMPESYQGWETEEGGTKERRNASLIEIKNLQRLTVLYLTLVNEKDLPEGLFTEQLERYQISVGENYEYEFEFWGARLGHIGGCSRSLQLNLYETKELNAIGLVHLMKMSEYLVLKSLTDVKNFVRNFDGENFPRLKFLEFKDNDKVQYIINSTDLIHSHHVFPCLESLLLLRLTRLKRICHGQLPVGSFKALRQVVIGNCDRLKNLLPLSIVKLLDKIIIRECKMMEEIVSTEREGDKIESFQLRTLQLHYLPKLVHFCCSNQKAACASSMIDYSKPLFDQAVLFPKLDRLEVDNINIEKLWPDQLSSASFMQNLSILIIERCNSLKYLFSFSLAQKFLNLKELIVYKCLAMEYIVVTNKKHGEEDTQLENILFPKLVSFELDGLSALQRFFSRNSCVEFPLPLSEVSVAHKKENLSTQSFFNEKILLPNLEELYFVDINVATLWPDQLSTNFDLQNLRILTVEYCDKIKYLFSLPMAERLVNLKMLEVKDCLAVEEILKLSEKRMLPQNILFSKLETLKLCGLPVFKTFCSESSCIKEPSADDDEEIVIAKHPFNGKIAFSSVTSYIHNLKELIVRDCNNLKYLLSSAMAGCLLQLKRLSISGCEIMEEVIINEESPGSKAIILEKLSLPKLEYLELGNLPNVRQFCEGDYIECPLLSQPEISNCPKLKAFITNSKDRGTCIIYDKKHE